MNDEDYESQTALHLAAGGGHHDIVLELLSAGADTDARSLYRVMSRVIIIIVIGTPTSGPRCPVQQRTAGSSVLSILFG